MNPILIVLIFTAGFLLWLICSFMYRPIGRFFNRLYKDAKEEMFKEETEETKENKK